MFFWSSSGLSPGKNPAFVQLVKQVIIKIKTQTPLCAENGLLLKPIKD